MCTNNKKLAHKASQLRSHGIEKDKNLFENECYGLWSYEQQSLGFNYRMNDIQAALGCAQIERAEYLINFKRETFHKYKYVLPNCFLNIYYV